jgi:hypothetical protein
MSQFSWGENLAVIATLLFISNAVKAAEPPGRPPGADSRILFELIDMIGFSSRMDVNEMKKAFDEDMKLLGSELPPDKRNYRSALKFQGSVLETLRKQVDRGANNLDRQRIAERSRTDLAVEQMASDREQFTQEREALLQRLERMQEDFRAQDERYRRMVEALEAQLKQRDSRIKELENTAGGGSKMRTWTDTSGQFRIQAMLLGHRDGKVYLRKADGKELAVSLDKLSKADRQYVASRADRQLVPESAR